MPMRILLIGAAVFLVAWFTVLKPGGAEEALPPVQPANATQPATTAATTATTPAAAEPTENTPVSAWPCPPTSSPTLPKGVAGALKERKTIVLGVFADDASNWRPMADDDRYVRNALKKTNRYDGEVFRQEHQPFPALDVRPAGQRPRRQSVAGRRRDRPQPQGHRPHRLRRPHRHQPGDRRRPPRQHRPVRSRTRTCSRPTQICERVNVRVSRWVVVPTISGNKARGKAAERLAAIDREELAAAMLLATPAKYKTLEEHLGGQALRRSGLTTTLRPRRSRPETPSSPSRWRLRPGSRRRSRASSTVASTQLGVIGCVENRRS